MASRSVTQYVNGRYLASRAGCSWPYDVAVLRRNPATGGSGAGRKNPLKILSCLRTKRIRFWMPEFKQP